MGAAWLPLIVENVGTVEIFANGFIVRVFPEVAEIILYRKIGEECLEVGRAVLPRLDYEMSMCGVVRERRH